MGLWLVLFRKFSYIVLNGKLYLGIGVIAVRPFYKTLPRQSAVKDKNGAFASDLSCR